MAYVSTFVYSDSVQTELGPNGPKQTIVTPLIHFSPMFIPGNFSFAVTYGIMDLRENSNHELQFIFKSPVNEQLLIDSGNVQINVGPNLTGNNMPEHAQGVIVQMDFRNIAFRVEGIYKSEVILNGKSLGEFPIPVYGKEKL